MMFSSILNTVRHRLPARMLMLSMLLLSLMSVRAQETTEPGTFPILLAYGNQDVSFGMYNLFTKANPVVSVGSEIFYSQNTRHRIGQQADLSFAANDVLGNKVSLSSAFFYRYCHRSGVHAGIGLGLGFAQQFHPRPVYEYDAEELAYKKAKDQGITTTQLGYNLQAGYDFKGELPIGLFVRYSFVIQSPYLDLDLFPIMPQSITQIGVKFQPRKK